MEKRKLPNCENIYATCINNNLKKSEHQMNVRLKIQKGPFKCKTLGKTKKGCKLKMLLILITGVVGIFDAKQKCMCKIFVRSLGSYCSVQI